MPASPPTSPSPSFMRPSTRSGSRMSMGSNKQYVSGTSGLINGTVRAPSRASGEEEDGFRTAVRVAVRIRPSLQPLDPGYELVPQRFQRSMIQTISNTSLSIESPQGRKLFVFDRIFGPEVRQEGVWEYLEDSISAFVQGYNVSVLAYGQSGAGKSYTMGTSDPSEQSNDEAMGVVPRAAEALFQKLSPIVKHHASGNKSNSRYSTPLPTLQKPTSVASQERLWSMKATYVEIYNEQLRDLLLPENTPIADRRQVNIREDTKGRILLTGLQEMQIESVNDLLAALTFGSSIRQTDATAINAKSSRSHAVFSINLIQRKPKSHMGREVREKRYSAPAEILNSQTEGFVTVDSKLHFVDLAGSERLKNTGALGDRAKEGISINAGLASLGKVISQLSSRQAGSHVSYRDSKLTRLLQDSLGGNAITYMVACVNPAEFHLSETLNTIQYAQRARAIQSKPQIQEVSSDGDLRVLVDRLRAEISFLREQIRSSESTNERSSRMSVDRSTEKELQLQNQILDIQENYSALSHRHAKLISDITKARDTEASSGSAKSTDVAEDRLARSNSFAEAVEQVVLEYEKTIQSLELSLSSTRSTLSGTESSLLEKEARLVYVETINSQLQGRVQKLSDRESSTEVYLVDLENKLSGHTSGEERNIAIITELRKEISRVRENEASCEEYISNLEERLAEGDQSMEIMQREIERLEHVVERQRSLGKLDNLLHELDTLTHESSENISTKIGGPVTKLMSPSFTTASENTNVVLEPTNLISSAGNLGQKGTDDTHCIAHSSEKKDGLEDAAPLSATVIGDSETEPEDGQSIESTSLAKKLEDATQQLDHVRSLYKSTLSDYSEMTTRYEGALKDLHSLQDQLDEQHHRESGLTLTGIEEHTPAFPHLQSMSSSAQTTSSEIGKDSSDPRLHDISLAMSPHYLSASKYDQISRRELIDSLGTNGTYQSPENSDHECSSELETQYNRLQEEHRHVLELVEDLKSSISKSRAESVISPTGGQVLRRKSSQNLIAVDRANRAFKGLRSMAFQYLDGNEDALEVFDLNLNAAIHELHTRSERIQELENEVSGLRKDTEAKAALINGLARERSSITNSPMDISVVSALQSRLAENEEELQRLHGRLQAQETEFEEKLSTMADGLGTRNNHKAGKDMLVGQNEVDVGSEKSRYVAAVDAQSIEFSRAEMDNGAVLLSVFDRLALLVRQLASSDPPAKTTHISDENVEHNGASRDLLVSSGLHFQLVERIREGRQVALNQLEMTSQIKETLSMEKAKLEQLQMILKSRSEKTLDQTFSTSVDSSATDHSIDTRRDLDLGLSTRNHTDINEIENLKLYLRQEQQARAAIESNLLQETDNRAANQALIDKLEARIKTTEMEISSQSSNVESLQNAYKKIEEELRGLEQEKSVIQRERESVDDINQQLRGEIGKHLQVINSQQSKLTELQELHVLVQKDLDELLKKESAHAGVIDQLEQQLASTYDDHQDIQRRYVKIEAELQALQIDRLNYISISEAGTQKATQEIESLSQEVVTLQTKLSDAQLELASYTSGPGTKAQRSNSVSSTNLRKSASTASLPSPPPIIPLPPLPAGQNHPTSPAMAVNTQPPATPTVSRRPSKDYVTTHLEDQEARIKTLEKQLQAEKALTATLEEALTDCEKTMKKLNTDKEMFQRRANQVQQELDQTRNESQSSRYSMQAMEDERLRRLKAEKAKEVLEERMQTLSGNKKKSRNFACF